MVTETWISYEVVNDPALGPWPEIHFTVNGMFWDFEENHPVDAEALVAAGYLKPVRITQTKEYL